VNTIGPIFLVDSIDIIAATAVVENLGAMTASDDWILINIIVEAFAFIRHGQIVHIRRLFWVIQTEITKPIRIKELAKPLSRPRPQTTEFQ